MSQPARDSSGVRFPPPLVYAIALGAGFLLQHLHPLPILPAKRGLARAAGIALMAAWAALSFAAIRLFRRAGTSINPIRPTTTLVQEGPYRISRNPLYLGLAMFCAGLAFFWNALWPVVFLAPTLVVVDRVIIRREERYLEEKFGETYRCFRRRVRRWL